MTKSEGELLPCPFCGNQPEVLPSGDGTGTMIQCITDDCVNPHTSWYGHSIAKKHWNTRTQQPDNQPAVSLTIAGEAAHDAAIAHYDEGFHSDGRLYKSIAKAVLNSLKAQGVEIKYE